MCGIAGFHRLTDRPFPKADQFASELLRGIEERGEDATGYVAINDAGDIQLQKASCSAFYFNQHRARIMDEARTVLLHTRLATQGKPAFPENNHPVECGGIYAVHNGHIWNDAEIFRTKQVARRGAVDSEAIPALVAARGWDSLPDSLSVLDGAMAVAMVNVHAPSDLVLARGYSSPLYVVQTTHLLVWASTFSAIIQTWRRALGTPPGSQRIEQMPEGLALIVKDGKVSKRRWKAYEPPVAVRPMSSISTSIAHRMISKGEPVAAAWDGKGWVSEDRRDRVDLAAEGFRYFRCEDCGEWLASDELTVVQTMGVSSRLCVFCEEWARRHNLVVE